MKVPAYYPGPSITFVHYLTSNLVAINRYKFYLHFLGRYLHGCWILNCQICDDAGIRLVFLKFWIWFF